MAKFRHVPEQIDAEQWTDHGDHPRVHRANHPDYSGGVDHSCGKSMGAHGMHVDLGVMVCPGDWIVSDHGVVTVWKDAAFRAAFEPGPVDWP